MGNELTSLNRELTRRQLLQLSALSLAGLAAGCAGSITTPIGGSYDVVVLGAGIAGMAAAQSLKSAGLSVLVVEARNRIGGRCFCDNSFPAPFDFGGQFFHQVVPAAGGGTNNPLYDIAVERGLGPVPVTLLPKFYTDAVERSEEESTPFKIVAALMSDAITQAGISAEAGGTDISAGEACAVFDGLPWFTLSSTFLELDLDASIDHASSLDAYLMQEHGTRSDEQTSDYANPGGMGNFIASFGTGLDIALGTVVTSVDWGTANGVVVNTNGGSIAAGAIVVTAPTNVIAAGKITFTPALPVQYQAAFADLPMGLVDKIGLAFSSNVFGDTPPNTAVTKFEDTAETGIAIVKFANQYQANVLVTGEVMRELEAAGRDAVIAYGKNLIRDTYGSDAAAAVVRGTTHAWGLDPWAMGSYSCAKPDRASARTTLALPLNERVYFAGEAVSVKSHSSLHGAYMSGQAAAAGIVASRSAKKLA